MEFNTIDEAILAIKNGEMVVVLDDEDRENEGDLVMAAELVTPEKINFMAKEGRGLICVPLDADIAERLNFYPMVQDNKESTKCNFTVSVDYNIDTSTGISASDRAKTVRAIADYSSAAGDFVRPGHIFPLIAKNGGTLVRAGHTEAAVDFARLAGKAPVGLICEIAREDGEMMRKDELFEFAKKNGLLIVNIKDLICYRRRSEKFVKLISEVNMPTSFGDFMMKVYKSEIDGAEHVALVKGDLDLSKPVLTRVHSECITSEVFHSLRCDCKAQLDAALEKISNEGSGVVLYMRQEGRGIGLANKLKAYDLQDQGYDTVDANVKLGFAPDLRDYGIGAQILVDIGLKDLKLMTNNPTKVVGLEGYGLNIVERVSLEVPLHNGNKDYMAVKKEKMGHILKNI